VPPDASRPVNPPHQDVVAAVAYLELEQLRHLLLRHAICANDGGGGRAPTSAAKIGWAAGVGAEAFDVELVEHPPARKNLKGAWSRR
jgi:hypothetical protein